MVFQNYALYPHMTVRRQHGVQPAPREGRRRTRCASASRRAAHILGLEDAARPLPAPALGRPAPARRDGSRHRAGPAGLPVRRAALEPRREAARRHARGDPGAAPAPQDDLDLRDPRPDRGDDDGRPDRRHARRPRRADRHAARALRRAAEPLRRRLHRLAGDELPAGRPPAPERRAATVELEAGGDVPAPPVRRGATAPRSCSAARARSTSRSRRTATASPAEVVVVEPTGADTHVLVPRRRCGIVAVFRERHALAPASGMHLPADIPKTHLFDAATRHEGRSARGGAPRSEPHRRRTRRCRRSPDENS